MDINLPPRGAHVLAAVSGGADSMAMLDILHRTHTGKLTAAHFNHRLRETSDRDEKHVKNFCEANSIACVTGAGDVAAEAKRVKQSVELTARELRYAFLREASARNGCTHIATAHTADDNAETVLINLIRGTGLRGLGGIPPERENILRPLLHVTRAEIESYLRERGIMYVTDETNDDTRYRRNAVRHLVMPALHELNPAFTESVNRLARLCREDEAFLLDLAQTAVREGKNPYRQPIPLASRMARLIYEQAGGDGRSLLETHISAVLHLRQTGQKTNLPGHLTAVRTRTGLKIEDTPPLLRR